jgi:hypothetical protein
VAAGRTLPAAPHHRGPVLAVAFGPGGRTLLTGSGDRTARVWDAATGVALGPPLWHRDAVQAVAFAPDGKTLLTGGRDRTAQQWEAPAGLVPGGVGQVQLWVRALTGLELDDDGTPRRLDEDAVQRLREALHAPEHAEFVRGVVLP